MLVTWKYRDRGRFLYTLDPRARWITSFFVLFSIIQFWDIRYMLFFFALGMTQYYMTGLTWKETRRVWMFIILLVVVIVGLNALLSGRGGPGEVLQSTEHKIWEANITIPLVNWNINPNITVNKLTFAITQIFRMLSSAVLFFIIPWTMDPRLYGVTFGGMGIPYRFAFSMDLAFRFVPSLARDFGVTLDAQRARGYEIEKLEGGVFQMIRKIAPLIVPIVMNSIINGEDITNAMDLRCFGLEKRTWIEKLTYRKRDYVWMAFGALIFITSLILNLGFGAGKFWVPEFMYLLAK